MNCNKQYSDKDIEKDRTGGSANGKLFNINRCTNYKALYCSDDCLPERRLIQWIFSRGSQ